MADAFTTVESSSIPARFSDNEVRTVWLRRIHQKGDDLGKQT